jgi:hypothetical protein
MTICDNGILLDGLDDPGRKPAWLLDFGRVGRVGRVFLLLESESRIEERVVHASSLASWQNATSARLARCPELRLGFPITDCDPESGAGG